MNPTAASSAINIAKIGECESLSGLSTLQYHVGYEVGSKDRIHIRGWISSGTGRFNQDWVSLESIEKCLSNVPANGTFKAAAFNALLPGRSVNTPYMIAAACLAEGLIRRSEIVSREYERNDAAEWLTEMQTLIEAGSNLTPAPMEHKAGDSANTTTKAKPGTPKKAKSEAAAAP